MKSSTTNKPAHINILGSRVDCSNYQGVIQRIAHSLNKKKADFVCVAAVHLIMEAYQDPDLQAGINQSLITTTDGIPLVWLARWYGQKQTQRVYGPELMLQLCRWAAQNNRKIFLLGGATDQSRQLAQKLQAQFPQLKIAGHADTPRRPIPPRHNQQILQQIHTSQAQIIFVGLGCPQQEWWMIRHSAQLPGAVCVGVGAAFDFITGRIKQAPSWMQRRGLEWLFRLWQEPRRLWRRYLILNTRFVLAIVQELFKKL